MNLLLLGVGLALGLALWPIVLPVLILIIITRTLSHPHRTMTALQPKPVRPAPAPVRHAIRNYTVHYTVNGMRASWVMAGRSEAAVISAFKDLLPQAKINLVSLEGDW